jgi:hypothetical protein
MGELCTDIKYVKDGQQLAPSELVLLRVPSFCTLFHCRTYTSQRRERYAGHERRDVSQILICAGFTSWRRRAEVLIRLRKGVTSMRTDCTKG